MIDLDENEVIAILSNPKIVEMNVVQDQNGIDVVDGLLTQDSVVEIYVNGDSKQIIKFLISTQYQCRPCNDSLIHLKLIKQRNHLGELVRHKLYVDLMDDLEITVNGKDPKELILDWVVPSHNFLAYSMTKALDGLVESFSQ